MSKQPKITRRGAIKAGAAAVVAAVGAVQGKPPAKKAKQTKPWPKTPK